MPLRTSILLFVAFVGGCMPRADERAREFAEDGTHLYQQGDFKLARECFEVALALRPDDPDLLYNVAQCYDRQGNNIKAEENYRLSLGKSANHAPCRRGLQALLCRTGRRAESDKLITDWLNAEPQRADAYVEDAWRYRMDGEIEPAKARLQQALALEPNHVRALTEIGLLYEGLELHENALQAYELALRRGPQQAELVSRVNAMKARGVKHPRPN